VYLVINLKSVFISTDFEKLNCCT